MPSLESPLTAPGRRCSRSPMQLSCGSPTTALPHTTQICSSPFRCSSKEEGELPRIFCSSVESFARTWLAASPLLAETATTAGLDATVVYASAAFA